MRFVLNPPDPTNPNATVRIFELGLPVSLINLNAFTSTTAVNAALAALNSLRPDPTRTEIEQLISVGNSFYHGLTMEVRNNWRQKSSGAGYSLRAVYTLSFLRDDGIVNTSDALIPGDFQRERSRSLLDRRHRFAFSGTFDTPYSLGHLRIAPIVRLASGAPFNLSLGGADRNLDDVSNDRPNFTGDPSVLQWRRPGEPIDPSILNFFSLPTIGQSGDLPRNAGTGPGQFIFDLNVSREFRIKEKMRLRIGVEFDNVLNATVFSFGSEFIDFNAIGPTATPAQRQAFIDSFMVATRTMRPKASAARGQVRFLKHTGRKPQWVIERQNMGARSVICTAPGTRTNCSPLAYGFLPLPLSPDLAAGFCLRSCFGAPCDCGLVSGFAGLPIRSPCGCW